MKNLDVEQTIKSNNAYLPLFFFCFALLYTPLAILNNVKREYCREKVSTDTGIGKYHYTIKKAMKVPDTSSRDSATSLGLFYD